jgi:hypothetical protein
VFVASLTIERKRRTYMAQTCTPSYDKRLKMKFGSICNLRGLLVIMEMMRERERERKR